MANGAFGINLPSYNPIDTSRGVSAAGALFDKAFSGLKNIADERNEFNADLRDDEKETNTQEAISQLQSLDNSGIYDKQADQIIGGLGDNVDLKAINEARNKQQSFIGENALRAESLKMAQNKNILSDKELGNYDADRARSVKLEEAKLAVQESQLKDSKLSRGIKNQKLTEAQADVDANVFVRNSFYESLVDPVQLEEAGLDIEANLSKMGDLEPGTPEYLKEFDSLLTIEKHRIATEKFASLDSKEDAAEIKELKAQLQTKFLSKNFETKETFDDLMKAAGLTGGADKDKGGFTLAQQSSAIDRATRINQAEHTQDISRAENKLKNNQKALDKYTSSAPHDSQFQAVLPEDQRGENRFGADIEGGDTPMADVNSELVGDLDDTPENIEIYQNMLFNSKKYKYKDFIKKPGLIGGGGLDVEKYKKAIRSMKTSLGKKNLQEEIMKLQTNVSNSQNAANILYSNGPKRATREDVYSKLRGN